MGMLVSILVALLLALLIGAGVRRARRRRHVPELNRHPERLEQTLDTSDDA
jgi:hypothetical protein